MLELLILCGLAWLLKGFLQAPTDQDVCDWIVMDEFEYDPDQDSL